MSHCGPLQHTLWGLPRDPTPDLSHLEESLQVTLPGQQPSTALFAFTMDFHPLFSSPNLSQVFPMGLEMPGGPGQGF